MKMNNVPMHLHLESDMVWMLSRCRFRFIGTVLTPIPPVTVGSFLEITLSMPAFLSVHRSKYFYICLLSGPKGPHFRHRTKVVPSGQGHIRQGLLVSLLWIRVKQVGLPYMPFPAWGPTFVLFLKCGALGPISNHIVKILRSVPT